MTQQSIQKQETTAVKEKIVDRPKLSALTGSPFCVGCHYGVIHRIVCEVIEELGIQGKCITAYDIGCNSSITRGAWDGVQALHGRSTVVATGIKRALPDAIVFHSGGDGALGAIGAGHLVNCMMRGELITTLFMNNAGYGMTGGQMAPTTLLGLRTTTSPEGRDAINVGFPTHIAEMCATFKGTVYSARVSVHTPRNFQIAKRAVKTAFLKQINKVGFGIVEFLSACPTDWNLNPVEANKFVADKMLAEFPLGVFKDVDKIEYEYDPEVQKVGRIRR